jgi:hypothetical protein
LIIIILLFNYYSIFKILILKKKNIKNILMILVGKYINENKEYKNPDILYSKMKIGNKIEILKKID